VGSGTPIEPPDLIDDKWYCCTVQVYSDFGPGDTCESTFRWIQKCCRLGAVIKDWKPHECVGFWVLCGFPDWEAQRLVKAVGPYDTFMECMDACL